MALVITKQHFRSSPEWHENAVAITFKLNHVQLQGLSDSRLVKPVCTSGHRLSDIWQ